MIDGFPGSIIFEQQMKGSSVEFTYVRESTTDSSDPINDKRLKEMELLRGIGSFNPYHPNYVACFILDIVVSEIDSFELISATVFVHKLFNRVPVTPFAHTGSIPLCKVLIVAAVVKLYPRILESAQLLKIVEHIAVVADVVRVCIEITRYNYGAIIFFIVLANHR